MRKIKEKNSAIMRAILISSILAIVIIILLVISIQVQPTEPTEGKLSADKVDIIPDIEFDECLLQIRATNPEMSERDAQDNCLAISAINKNDRTLCNQIASPKIRQACLAQF